MTEGGKSQNKYLRSPFFPHPSFFSLIPRNPSGPGDKGKSNLCLPIRTVRFDRATVVFSSAAMVFSPLFLPFNNPPFMIFVAWIFSPLSYFACSILFWAIPILGLLRG